MKRIIRSTLRTVWSKRRPTRANRVLYYHSVHPTLARSTTPDLFECQLEHLLESGYRFITQREIPMVARDPAASPWVVIGFDDGYEDNHTVAAPILKRYGVAATFYVVAGQVGDENRVPDPGFHLYPERRMMSVAQIRSLAEDGHEIASHGLQHELATDVLRLRRNLAHELRVSRQLLSDWSGQNVVSYSYPNGQNGSHSRATRASVTAAGFASAAGTLWGAVSRNPDLTLLPRCEISATDGREQFRWKLNGRADYLAVAHRVRRTPTW